MPKVDDTVVPVRLPVIPKEAMFRMWAYDWVAPNGDRWDHKGNPLPPSFLSTYRRRNS